MSYGSTYGFTKEDLNRIDGKSYRDGVDTSVAMRFILTCLQQNTIQKSHQYLCHYFANINPEVRRLLSEVIFKGDNSVAPSLEYCRKCNDVKNIPLDARASGYLPYHLTRKDYMRSDELKQALMYHVSLDSMIDEVMKDPGRLKKVPSNTLAGVLINRPDLWNDIFPLVKQTSYYMLVTKIKNFTSKIDFSSLSKTTVNDMVYEKPSIAFLKDFPVEKMTSEYSWSAVIRANPDKAKEILIKKMNSDEKFSKTVFRQISLSFPGKFKITGDIASSCPLSAKELILHCGRNKTKLQLEDGLAEALEADLLSEFLFGSETNSTILKNKLKSIKETECTTQDTKKADNPG